MAAPSSSSASDTENRTLGTATMPPARGAINYVRRLQDRAHYDEDTIHRIIDEALICHVAFNVVGSLDGNKQDNEDWPVAMPMVHGRINQTVYIHGYVSGRLMKVLSGSGSKEGESVAGKGPKTGITFTMVDGLVLSLSPFHNSMNYRSACVFGHARLVTNQDEKIEALRAITDHAFKIHGGGDRYEESRPPNDIEMKSTKVIAVEIEAASAKIRDKPVIDDETDVADKQLTERVWTGVLNTEQRWTSAVKMPYSPEEVPAYVQRVLDQAR